MPWHICGGQIVWVDFSHHVRPRDETQAISFDDKYLYLLSHLSGPGYLILDGQSLSFSALGMSPLTSSLHDFRRELSWLVRPVILDEPHLSFYFQQFHCDVSR